jgi:hypothetical protein
MAASGIEDIETLEHLIRRLFTASTWTELLAPES